MEQFDDDPKDVICDVVDSISKTQEKLVTDLCDIQIRHCKRMIKILEK